MNIAQQFADATPTGFVPHAKYHGVALKHLVTGQSTGARVSVHLVRVEPGCVLDTHTHPGQVEIHQVIDGSGDCQIGDDSLAYQPGVVGIVPAGVPHRVVAGENGLVMLATFSPALF